MQPYEIFNAAFMWRNCNDMRPWLIVQLRPNGLLGCLPISSECYQGSCFPLPKSHPDFPATGLTKSCYITDDHIYDLSVEAFRNRRGELRGELLKEFREFSGL